MTMQLGIAGSDAMALVSAPTIIRTRRNLAKPNPFNAVHKARRERAKLALKTQKKDSKGKKKTPKPKPKPKPVAAGGRSKSKKAAKADQAGKRCHEQNLHDAETEDEDEDGDTKMLGLPHVSKDKGKDKDRDIKMLDSDDKVDSDIEMSDAPSSDDIDEDIAMLDPAYVAYSSFTFQSPGTNPDPYSMEEDSEPIAFSRLWTNRQPSLEITPRLLGNLRMRIRDGNWSFKNVALSSHSKLPGAERAMLDLPTDPTDEGFASAYASMFDVVSMVL